MASSTAALEQTAGWATAWLSLRSPYDPALFQ
jgi:hypothetical protein